MHLGERNFPLDEQPRNCQVERESDPSLEGVEVHSDVPIGWLVGYLVSIGCPEKDVLENLELPLDARKLGEKSHSFQNCSESRAT